MRQNRKLDNFLSGKGFYIILIICIAAVGVSGYALFFSGANSDMDAPDLGPSDVLYAPDTSEAPVITTIPDYALRDTEVVMADDYLSQVSGEADIPEPTPEAAEKPVATKAPAAVLGQAEAVSGRADIPVSITAPFFTWPINGEVLATFSVDELVFNSTTDDWRVHTGLDIAAPSGAHVGAIGAGTVEDVYEDELMGWSVVINHGNGVRSVSRGLMSDITVAVGDRVTAGQTIGGVGTIELEGGMPSHLHLEVVDAGAYVDPLTLLP